MHQIQDCGATGVRLDVLDLIQIAMNRWLAIAGHPGIVDLDDAADNQVQDVGVVLRQDPQPWQPMGDVVAPGLAPEAHRQGMPVGATELPKVQGLEWPSLAGAFSPHLDHAVVSRLVGRLRPIGDDQGCCLAFRSADPPRSKRPRHDVAFVQRQQWRDRVGIESVGGGIDRMGGHQAQPAASVLHLQQEQRRDAVQEIPQVDSDPDLTVEPQAHGTVEPGRQGEGVGVDLIGGDPIGRQHQIAG